MHQTITQKHTVVVLPAGVDIWATWPRNAHGDYICTATRPMPKNKPLKSRWEHDDVKETNADSDYYIEYRCGNCGHVWRTEMPD